MDDVTLEQSVTLLKAMAHPCRLRLLLALAGGRVCDVTTLIYLSGLPQPYVSQQLRILRKAGLVVGERHGPRICYRLADSEVVGVLAAVGLLEAPIHIAKHLQVSAASSLPSETPGGRQLLAI